MNGGYPLRAAASARTRPVADAAASFREEGDQHNKRIALDDLDAARGAQQASG